MIDVEMDIELVSEGSRYTKISDELDAIEEGLSNQIANTLDDIAGDIARSMRRRLDNHGHIDTGQLFNSIRYETEVNRNTVESSVYIDAKSKDGAWYAEFLEFGTGIYNEDGLGRQTPWAWQDRFGNWHITNGMTPDPFIRPSIAENVSGLEEEISHDIGELRRYKK